MANLTLNAVHKSYGPVDVIHGIDMQIESGEFCVFVGPSGCGKSTLLRMIAGLENITKGEVQIDGAAVNHIPAAQRGLAMVFQSYALYPHMSVRQNMSFGLQNMRMSKTEITERVAEAARMLQIEPLMDRKPGQLSGGQRQRIAIGRAVVREPKIFLFDEPLSNLDAELRVAMRAEISDLHGRLGNTMIYVTHDQVEAMTMADKIAVLRAGVVEQFGKPLDLFNTPQNRFVAGFIGSPAMNFLKGTVKGGAVALENGAVQPVGDQFTVTEGQEVELGIRAGDLRQSEGAGIRATITGVEQLGTESYLYCKTSRDEPITTHQLGQTTAQKGQEITLSINAGAMHLFDQHSGQSCRST
ncbi:Maltose maltodextrin transport ATP-binding protein malK [Candidatus Rhodobacter oscarellae]|uniref:Maltose maltodextrin transport ATP-binding protein malK n=1 Tax=Candidatus Rhodobacter oscarellae TaxID=1675527 RepID=A0A0J9E3Q1_9RHOB|nr:sn-glycerol-3-phosphate ABC transporter ATP-binding protein UgpC [Candidatus Rhodobacter lobularis]KMW57332.1 Maltose maltodextrin transport ATP-binding protein malK [Candidatus Rhodobacter lobularis]